MQNTSQDHKASVATSNDATVYQHQFAGIQRTGRQLDPSGSGHVPTHWVRVGRS